MAVCHVTLLVVLVQTCRADLIPPGTPGQENEGLLTYPHTKIHQDLTTHSAGPDQEGKAAIEIGISTCPRTCVCVASRGNTQLTVTNCKTDPLPELPALFKEYRNISILEIGNSHLSEIPSDIDESLPDLVNLSLDINDLQYVPKGVFNITKLWKLVLPANRIQVLPQEISKLTLLQVLEMSRNELEYLPAEITELSMLTSLRLDKNKITKLPQELSELTNLNKLSLNQNLIKSLPGDLWRLSRLTDLQLSFNLLRELPDDLWILNLEHLELQHNKLQTISCYAFGIRYLDLSYNALKSLDCDFRLKHTDIAFNKTTDQHKLANCRTGIEQLFLNNNNIAIIDNDVFSYCSWRWPSKALNLANNKLRTLDSWPLMLAMNRTITIDFSGNMLSRFTNSAETYCPFADHGSVINMSTNRIKYFMDVFNGWNVSFNSRQDLHRFMYSTFFDLGNNPLVCDCVDYEVYRYIQTPGTPKYKETNLVCDKPMILKGKNPGHISLERFVCDISANCPKGCTCTNIPHISTLDVNCINYGQNDVPTVLPDLPKQSFAYHLNFSNQNLSMISSRSYLCKATEIILTNNSLQFVSSWSLGSFRIVEKLYLDGNQLQTLPESILRGNQTATDIKLGNNPWICDCKTMVMKDWIVSNSHIVTDQDRIICQSPVSMAGTKVTDIERSLVCPNENKTAIYVVVVVVILLLIGMAYLAVADRVRYAYRRLVSSDECYGEGKEFDVFVSYATENEDYVEGFLIPELERHDYRVCFHRVHFLGGKPILVNISEAIEKSKRTLVFFSNSFKDSPFGMFEFRLAHHLDVENKTRRLITIKDTDLDMDDLYVSEYHYFQIYTYISREAAHFWRNLEHTLPRIRLGAEVP